MEIIGSKLVRVSTVGVGWAEVGLPYNCISLCSEMLCLFKVETPDIIGRFLNEDVGKKKSSTH